MSQGYIVLNSNMSINTLRYLYFDCDYDENNVCNDGSPDFRRSIAPQNSRKQNIREYNSNEEIKLFQSGILRDTLEVYFVIFDKHKYGVCKIPIEPQRIFLKLDIPIYLMPYRTSSLEAKEINSQIQSLLAYE